MFRSFLVVVAIALSMTSVVTAHELKIGEIGVETPWARATIGAGKTGVIYLTLHNHGTNSDRLIAVATPIAKRAALHTHNMDKGVMRMRPVDALEVAIGKPIALEPGGRHIMMMGLKYPLREGGSFPLTLTFENAGSATIMVDVRSATASGGHQHE